MLQKSLLYEISNFRFLFIEHRNEKVQCPIIPGPDSFYRKWVYLIFSLVTATLRFNRERWFWSLREVSSNFTADLLFCFVCSSLCKFFNSSSMKQIWFFLPESSLEHTNSWPMQQSCQKSTSKLNVLISEIKLIDSSNIILIALCYDSYNKFATDLCRRFGTVFACESTVNTLQRDRRGCLSLMSQHCTRVGQFVWRKRSSGIAISWLLHMWCKCIKARHWKTPVRLFASPVRRPAPVN